MFTGIVEEIGTVKSIRTQQSVRTLDISCQKIIEDMHIGDSISVNGACLTVIDFKQNQFSVQVIKGTENKTYLANIKENDEVNLERAMSGSGHFGGHFVLGHVDAKGTIINIRETPNSRIVSIKASDSVIKQMVKQGSITVDGVSLTILTCINIVLISILFLKQDVQRFFLTKRWAMKCILKQMYYLNMLKV